MHSLKLNRRTGTPRYHGVAGENPTGLGQMYSFETEPTEVRVKSTE